MTLLRLPLFLSLVAVGSMVFTSCTVEENSSASTGNSARGASTRSASKKEGTTSLAEKREAARAEREKERAAAEKVKARELAARKKKDEAEAREIAEAKKEAEAAKKMLAEKRAKEKAAQDAARKKAREEKIAQAKKEREARSLARNRESSREVAAVAERSGGGGFFSSLAVSTPSKYKSKGHHVHVNNRLLGSLGPSNAKIEIDISEQRARVYKVGAGTKQLVIETQISTGKSGHSTPTGTFRISEKLVQKRSSRYGRWVNSSGQTIRSSGDSNHRPSGASSFVGAEMPYWMRVTGGIGMHIGYVPNGPASHGCIRVPSAVQPLIFSKVGVGTQVTIVQ